MFKSSRTLASSSTSRTVAGSTELTRTGISFITLGDTDRLQLAFEIESAKLRSAISTS
jgi:hypothetical protein